MRGTLRTRLLLAGVAVVVFVACKSRGSRSSSQDPAKTDPSEEIERREQIAAKRDIEACRPSTLVYEGSIAVEASDYVHPVERGDDYVDVPIEGLDRIITKSRRVEFGLDYPFEEPFLGEITGEITLRRTIDAIRAGFRTMYEGTTEKDIPGLENKDVTGPYGQAFHVIGDLVIEEITLCGDDFLAIAIGS